MWVLEIVYEVGICVGCWRCRCSDAGEIEDGGREDVYWKPGFCLDSLLFKVGG